MATDPDSKAHGANMGAHLGPVGSRWAHVGHMNLYSIICGKT